MPPPTPEPQHRGKRPFQPAITTYLQSAITTYFPSTIASDFQPTIANDSITHAKPHHASLVPPVPHQVQSDLRSVGMCVRKSVPEGYKTPKTVAPLQPSATLPTPLQPSATLHTPLRKPRSAFRDTHPALDIPHDTRATSLQHQRELLPFCGLNKMGGYAEQPTPHNTFAANTTAIAHAFSQPFSSQDSAYPTHVQRARGKRGWADDDTILHLPTTNFLFSTPNALASDEDVPVSPLSESPPPPSLPPQRQLAQPKPRRHRTAPTDLDLDLDLDLDVDMEFGSVGVHEGRLAAGHASDFEEADFLDGEVGMDRV